LQVLSLVNLAFTSFALHGGVIDDVPQFIIEKCQTPAIMHEFKYNSTCFDYKKCRRYL
jgi:hypothetical protein